MNADLPYYFSNNDFINITVTLPQWVGSKHPTKMDKGD